MKNTFLGYFNSHYLSLTVQKLNFVMLFPVWEKKKTAVHSVCNFPSESFRFTDNVWWSLMDIVGLGRII